MNASSMFRAAIAGVSMLTGSRVVCAQPAPVAPLFSVHEAAVQSLTVPAQAAPSSSFSLSLNGGNGSSVTFGNGGNVQLLDVKEGTVYLRLGGGCQGCGHADTTVKEGIQSAICEEVPEIHTVLDVTDHAAGTNPYFQG